MRSATAPATIVAAAAEKACGVTWIGGAYTISRVCRCAVHTLAHCRVMCVWLGVRAACRPPVSYVIQRVERSCLPCTANVLAHHPHPHKHHRHCEQLGPSPARVACHAPFPLLPHNSSGITDRPHMSNSARHGLASPPHCPYRP